MHRDELVRLAKLRLPIREFSKGLLGKSGFLVTCEETNVTLSDGSTWRTGAELRDKFHLTHYSTADLFVPCGGRPNSVTTETVKSLFTADGVRPRFRMVVEGANLFFSDGAREILDKAGCHVFKDASTNKGGVCSSSLEVFAALALPDEEHTELMTYNPEDGAAKPPEFYATYVRQILDVIVENAKQEFGAIWACCRAGSLSKVEATRRLSIKVNRTSDSIQEQLRAGMSQQEREELVRTVLLQTVPPLMLERLGVDGILARVPANYIGSIVGAWIASRFVYRYGIDASDVSFFFFMRSLTDGKRADAEAGSARPTKASGDQTDATPAQS